MPGERHNVLVATVCDRHVAKSRGFGLDLFKQLLHEDEVEEFSPTWEKIIPDAYQVYADDHLVVCYEIELASEIDDAKLKKYVRLWNALDFYDWDLRLITVDRWGTEKEILLGDWYLMYAAFGES